MSYNENHTTGTKRALVLTMAMSERVVINPDHLEGNDGTVAMAMQLWSSRNGPVKYNMWQSLYFALCREGYVDAAEPGQESLAERHKRIRELYYTIQEELHGPDHLAQAVKAGTAQQGDGRDAAVTLLSGTQLSTSGGQPVGRELGDRKSVV